MPTRPMISLLLLALTGIFPVWAEEAELLPPPTRAMQTLPSAAVSTTAATTTVTTTKKSPAEAPSVCETVESVEPVCSPARRIRVVIPPPEVVFRYADGSCSSHGHKGHKGPHCISTVPLAPPAPAADGGQLAFNMNFSLPYSIMGAGGLGLGGSMLGGGGAGGGASGLASLLGLTDAPVNTEAQLMRTMISMMRERSNAEAELDARIRRLDNQINDRIESAMQRMQDDNLVKMNAIMAGVVDIQKRIKALEDRMP